MRTTLLILWIVATGCNSASFDNRQDLSRPVDGEQQTILVSPEELPDDANMKEILITPGNQQEVIVAFASCKTLQETLPGSISGVYQLFLEDQVNGVVLYNAQCDLENEGGGWTMILNYVHMGNTNPDLNIRTDSFPLLGSSTLGDVVQNTQYFGHLAPNFVNQFQFTELRFFCETEGHDRVMHFVTNSTDCSNYARTGTGDCRDVGNNFTALTGHTTELPLTQDISASADENNQALTMSTLRNPMGQRHWSIRNGNDWECDDDPDNDMFNTIHRMWVR